MKTKRHFLWALLLTCASLFSQVPQNGRTLAWQIDPAETETYEEALAFGQAACMESVHIFMGWDDLEADTGSYFFDLLDVMNVFYPAFDQQVELQLAPTNTVAKSVPSELLDTPFDDSLMIAHFARLLDSVFLHIPDLKLAALNIGNESDIFFGAYIAQYAAYKVFLDAAAEHARLRYFDLHGEALNVGTTFTFGGLTNPVLSPLCQSVNEVTDVVSTTYYPLNSDFTMKSPAVVGSDFANLVATYPDSTKPIYFAECGYSSSSVCNSSEAQQADFWSEVFTAWDTYATRIPYMTVFKSSDWSAESVNQFGEFYGVSDTTFKEYLRTLGVRTWPSSGENKMAYDRILCELADRDWCGSTCTIASASTGKTQVAGGIFPNPAGSGFTIPSNDEIYAVELFHKNGTLIKRWVHRSISGKTLDCGELARGLYFYRMTGADGEVLYSGKLALE